MRRKRQIPYALSQETLPGYRQALQNVDNARQNKNAKVIDVLEGDDGAGNPIGIIVVEEDV
ncbi:MAG: hypothetical protein ACYDH9_19105 [Limisphaerales bacterium]